MLYSIYLNEREGKIVPQILSVLLVSGNDDVNKNGALFDFFKSLVFHEFLKETDL